MPLPSEETLDKVFNCRSQGAPSQGRVGVTPLVCICLAGVQHLAGARECLHRRGAVSAVVKHGLLSQERCGREPWSCHLTSLGLSALISRMVVKIGPPFPCQALVGSKRVCVCEAVSTGADRLLHCDHRLLSLLLLIFVYFNQITNHIRSNSQGPASLKCDSFFDRWLYWHFTYIFINSFVHLNEHLHRAFVCARFCSKHVANVNLVNPFNNPLK